MLLGFLAHADVADCRRHQDPLSAFERAQHDFDGKLAAILPPCNEFDPGADLLRQRFCGATGTVGDQAFREALGNDVCHLLPYQLIAAVSELFPRLDIQQDNIPAGVHHHHRIRRRSSRPRYRASD